MAFRNFPTSCFESFLEQIDSESLSTKKSSLYGALTKRSPFNTSPSASFFSFKSSVYIIARVG
ncbi:hypothetical protein HanRHA438_Chr09g0402901 [Helianthus annuus]|nr:hypothetical protein HanIR_Chr09g0422011 [Helianthus annuus]KAJ0888522.1 hypothetical protein HanRHA438_Chr09g0402901 [Helianthus annuus]